MVQIPDALCCLFSTEIEQCDGSFVLEVPSDELETGNITPGETYRVAIAPVSPDEQSGQASSSQRPPVRQGERRAVSIETMGDQGDGIARVERGYVVIVPGSVPGDDLTVEIQTVKQNFAMAEIVDEADLTYE